MAYFPASSWAKIIAEDHLPSEHTQFEVVAHVSSEARDDYDFVEQPSEDFFCPVSMDLLLEPQQTSCCGNHLSPEAASRLQREGRPCPVCNEPQWRTMLDKFHGRKVRCLRVRCPHKKSGCDWEGEVVALERHVDSCPKRTWECPHCKLKCTCEEGDEHHWPVCSHFPEMCPNGCEVGSMPRCELEQHHRECLLEPVACEMKDFGCNLVMFRKDLKKHLHESELEHLTSMGMLNLRLTRQLQEDAAEKDIKIGQLQQGMEQMKQQIQTVQEGVEMVQGVAKNLDQQKQEIYDHISEKLGQQKQEITDQIMKQLQQEKDRVEHFVETFQFLLTDTSTLHLGKSFSTTLRCSQSINPNDIEISLQSLVDVDICISPSMVEEEPGLYRVSCTPQLRGRHDIFVKYKGQNIKGSPFHVFVKIHPTQLGSPVRTLTGFEMPYGIAINNHQQLVITEWKGKKVSIIERSGKKVKAIECNQFKTPNGVATLPDGTVYVSDGGARCIFKFDSDGNLMKTALIGMLKCPLFVKAIKNRLYISDRDSNAFHILDTDCNILETISTSSDGLERVRDMAMGEDGLYVVGRGNAFIYIYKKSNGRFHYHHSLQKPSVNLSRPKGICFDSSGYLYVTERAPNAQCTHVFDSSGKHQATFGQASKGVDMKDPAGIAIDEDGFVYVCDWSMKNTIHVF